MNDEELEPFDRKEWRHFNRVVTKIWVRLQRFKPRTALCDAHAEHRRRPCLKHLQLNPDTDAVPEPPPWLEERIQKYAARVAAGLLIFEDVSVADAIRREGGRDKGGRPPADPADAA